MIVTEPISPELLDEIGLVQGITFADFRNLIIYGQRTKDNRIAFGGRGAPYHFGSSVKAEYDTVEKIHVFLEKELKDLFPQLKEVKITHNWGGALGVARDWMTSVRLDSVTKIGQAGGYVGDGVGTSNLAGRTMADLILGNQSDLTALAFVNHRSPRWEVEPFRFIAARGAMLAARIADVIERSTGRQSFITSIIRFLTGKR
jgi:glycine/D-amino acid oxidase-like deaminating enzyme